MINLMSIGAGAIVSFLSLIFLRLLSNNRINHFSIKIFIVTFIIVYGGIIATAQSFNDIIVICFPVVIIAALEKTAIVYLARFVNNDKTSIIKLFIIISYFSGLCIAKYML